MNRDCQTAYPIVLIHGAGFRDLKWPVYWGRIPSALAARGADVHYGLQDCWGSIETNAEAIAKRIDEILCSTGAKKVNLIAHSKGGLDARMAISRLGMAEKVASLTTIATPHRGSETFTLLLRAPHKLFRLAAFAVDNWIRLIGDKRPDFYRVCTSFSTEYTERFNAETPDHPCVYYQSVGCVMGRPLSDIHLSTANFVVRRIEGDNDGLVSLASAQWGERFSVWRRDGLSGVSHLDAIDFRRRPIGKRSRAFDVCEEYAALVRGLKEMGF